MKKELVLSLALIGPMMGAVTSHATVREGWERPVRSAQMEILSAKGVFGGIRNVSLTMTKQDGQKHPTGLSLLIDGRTAVNLTIESRQKDSCGTVYSATTGPSAPGHDTYRIELIDYTNSRCEMVYQYQWSALVTLREAIEERALASMKLGGNPGPVYTIMNSAQPTLPNPMTRVLACHETNGSPDQLYSVSVYRQPRTGQYVAYINEITFGGQVELRSLTVKNLTPADAPFTVYAGKNFHLRIDLNSGTSNPHGIRARGRLDAKAAGRDISEEMECRLFAERF